MPYFQNFQSLLVSGAEGWHNGDDQISYQFITRMPDYYHYSSFSETYYVSGEAILAAASIAMDARQKNLMVQAIEAWNTVANVNLTPALSGVGDVIFGSTAFSRTSLFGFISDFPTSEDLGGRPSPAGDVWINTSNPYQYVPGIGPMLGHTSWNTYLHELGHALGLHHPNERPSAETTNGQFTVMSYQPHPGEADLNYNAQGWALTPMLWDIQAMQALYGANTETRTDATSYFGDGDGRGDQAYQYGADGMTVQGGDGVARNVSLTIWDAGGQDLMDASDLETNSRIDLRPGQYSTIGNLENNIAVASAVEIDGRVINLIEDAWGGAGDDQLIGNGTANELIGNEGRDTLRGVGRSDTIFGGHGSDILLGGYGRDVLYGGNGRDTLKGSVGRDTLDGGNGNDRLSGGKGADVFVFSAGDDRLIGFRGKDRIDLSAAEGISGFDDLRDNHIDETARGARITDDAGHSLLLVNRTFDMFDADDFLF
ncbi:M10 family metallopeptidase C-terminal domain-containing protein [Phaeobacter inhibens]|uniref:M10 family metallopeptidase C-terminal domain-containing protein n=1 Tax=Phaeobacter inhibens TaxID=221822 RepID=UPI000C9AA2EF|nr:M10 family metallopeptidase C-terminal domain-containing protein [Phaeobacter inhibens]AUQ68773.1 putative metallopeptidase [Phaeobacter inhibens]